MIINKFWKLPLLTFFILVCSVIFSFSFTSVKKQFVPPGTVRYNDTLFVDEAEVSNSSWREYEAWVKNKYGKNSKEHLAVLPDTTVWREKNFSNEPYVLYYYRHPAYKDFPVIGVSYEQAKEYCKWRTERVSVFKTLSKKNPNICLEYRLPSKYEWELLSFDLNNVFARNGWDEKGKRMVNTCWMKDTSDARTYGDKLYPEVLAPIYSYKQSTIGVYNMIGNAAEMVIEKGICKGGSWRHQLEECRVGKDIPYSKPSAWLGFRCVCVVSKISG